MLDTQSMLANKSAEILFLPADFPFADGSRRLPGLPTPSLGRLPLRYI